MKKTINLTLLFILIFLIKGNAQVVESNEILITFDSNKWQEYIEFTDPENNVWEVGQPQGQKFDFAYSYPNAIATNLNGNYQKNDTSCFIVKQNLVQKSALPKQGISIAFTFKSEINKNDFGSIYCSGDKKTWFSIFDSGSYYNIYWFLNYKYKIDSLTGNIDNWTILYGGLNINFYYNYLFFNLGDTIYYKICLFSDSSNNKGEGWIIDDILLSEAFGLSIGEASQHFGIYPNPFKDNIQIENRNNIDARITLQNLEGKILFEKEISTTENISTGWLKPGPYILVLNIADEKYVYKIFKQN